MMRIILPYWAILNEQPRILTPVNATYILIHHLRTNNNLKMTVQMRIEEEFMGIFDACMAVVKSHEYRNSFG